VGLLLGFFIRAQHLSKEHEAAELGIRKKSHMPESTTDGVLASIETGEEHDMARVSP